MDSQIDYDRIPEFAARALEQKPAIVELVQRYVFMENCVVVGRGLAYANAYEFALKLMETCYVVAERFSSADFLHGPVAMIERHFPVMLFAPPGVMLDGTKDLIRRLQELRADTLAITGDIETATMCSRSIIMPREIDEFLAPIPYIIPAQLFAALLAEAKGLDPDKPRSFSKVTRNPVDSNLKQRGTLLRVLGVGFGLAVTIGGTIGMGILRTPGEVATALPNTYLYIGVWILGGLYALLGANSVAELGAMIPRSGGWYVFIQRAMGNYPGFVIGYSDWLSTCGTLAVLSLVVAEYAACLCRNLAVAKKESRWRSF